MKKTMYSKLALTLGCALLLPLAACGNEKAPVVPEAEVSAVPAVTPAPTQEPVVHWKELHQVSDDLLAARMEDGSWRLLDLKGRLVEDVDGAEKITGLTPMLTQLSSEGQPKRYVDGQGHPLEELTGARVQELRKIKNGQYPVIVKQDRKTDAGIVPVCRLVRTDTMETVWEGADLWEVRWNGSDYALCTTPNGQNVYSLTDGSPLTPEEWTALGQVGVTWSTEDQGLYDCMDHDLITGLNHMDGYYGPEEFPYVRSFPNYDEGAGFYVVDLQGSRLNDTLYVGSRIMYEDYVPVGFSLRTEDSTEFYDLAGQLTDSLAGKYYMVDEGYERLGGRYLPLKQKGSEGSYLSIYDLKEHRFLDQSWDLYQEVGQHNGILEIQGNDADGRSYHDLFLPSGVVLEDSVRRNTGSDLFVDRVMVWAPDDWTGVRIVDMTTGEEVSRFQGGTLR